MLNSDELAQFEKLLKPLKEGQERIEKTQHEQGKAIHGQGTAIAQIKNFLFIASLFVLLFSFAIQTAGARSGCCSHHGGVCGCGCCDGSPLSAICAPYYPECNSTTGTTTSNIQE